MYQHNTIAANTSKVILNIIYNDRLIKDESDEKKQLPSTIKSYHQSHLQLCILELLSAHATLRSKTSMNIETIQKAMCCHLRLIIAYTN